MKNKGGFTLVEISLFIALSAVLFLVITIGVQNSIYQQRYNDSVQSFTDFLRNVYSEVTNVQNDIGGGTSDQAIYGKLVTFGESTNLSGGENEDRTIFSYNVVGDISDIGSGLILDELTKLNANVLIKDKDGVRYAGMVGSYNMKWSSVLQDIGFDGTTGHLKEFKGALLVVRSPKTGVINTFAMKDKTVEVNDAFWQTKTSEKVPKNLLAEYFEDKGGSGSYFSIEQMDFCVNPLGNDSIYDRANVRINKNARNSAGINIHYDNDEGNACRW